MGDEEHHTIDPQPQQDHRVAAGHSKPGEHGDPQPVQQRVAGGPRLTVRNAKTQDTQLGEFMRTFSTNSPPERSVAKLNQLNESHLTKFNLFYI